MKRILAVVIVVLSLVGCKSKPTVDVSVNGPFNLDSFLGEWFEIARYDYSYEKNMDKSKAIYSVRRDGTIEFVNTGLIKGEPKYAKGAIKLTEVPRHLRISFFGPFYGDYLIFYLDDDYTYALVGSSSDKYLWLLSRAPQLDEERTQILLEEARRRGFDTDKLVWVVQ